ncbi:MAG: hypothetical protein ACYTGQ_16160, partial [Planctomycetota bacterium]
MNITKLGIFLLSGLALTAVACGDTQEYEITGEVSASAAVSGPISLEFFELEGEGEEAERVSVKTVELAALGSFSEVVEAEADATLIAFALADTDGDGKCTEGELWAETEITPAEDGTVEAIALPL